MQKEDVVKFLSILGPKASALNVEEGEEFAKQLEIDLSNLSDEVTNQPAAFVWAGSLCAQAKKEKAKAKLDLQLIEARTRLQIKEQFSGGKAPTVDDMAAMVKLSPQVVQANADLIAADELLDKIQAYEEGFRQKADMLKLLAYLVRRETEMKNQI